MILLQRLKPYSEEIKGDYQYGFRPGRSTINQIFIVQQIMEKNWECNKDVYHIFLDLQQMYDSIDRELLWMVLLEMETNRVECVWLIVHQG